MGLDSPYRCLVVGPSWVGDMLMAQSLFKALAARHPGLELDVLAPAWSHGILARMPEVRRALVAPFSHGSFGLKERWRLGRELAREGYDQAIVLPNSWKSALLPFFAGIPLRTGYLGEFRHGVLNDKRRLDKQAMPRLVERYSALALPPSPNGGGGGGEGAALIPPQPGLTVDPDAQQASLDRLGLKRDHRILALCPGAEFGPAKRWPEAHYAAVARAKLQQGWQVWLFGSAKDRAVTDAIAALVPSPSGRGAGAARDLADVLGQPSRLAGSSISEGTTLANLAGQTTLEETVDLLACADAVVSNDSGLMHIAAAVDVPLVAVYGSTDPGYTPPYSSQAKVVRLGLECSPCFKRECPLGHLDCLNKLGPERVLEVLPE